jgi:hypothetical protein
MPSMLLVTESMPRYLDFLRLDFPSGRCKIPVQ